MQFDRAWDFTTGSSDVIVGLIDTGFDWEHLDLDTNVVWINPAEDINHNNRFDNYPSSQGGDLNGVDDDPAPGNGYVDDVIGWDFWNGDNNPAPPDTADGNHGTIVGSIITAETNQGNAYGVAGTSWNGRIMVLRAGDENHVDLEGIIDAINYAIDNGADILNMSFSSAFDVQQLEDAIQDADAAGLIMVGSAGDDDSDDEMYPGSYDEVIRVAAVDSMTAKTPDSNYGTDVAICAPSGLGGVDGIVTCDYGTSADYPGDQEPHVFKPFEVATSGGAAEVTGVVALIKAVNPGATKQFIIDELVRGATPLGDALYGQGKLGAGMANAYRSVTQWGTIDENTTWSNAAFVSGDLNVASGKTLTIAAGTTIWIARDDNEQTGGDSERVEWVIDGYLDVEGTEANPVVIQAYDPQGRDDWMGLHFSSSGQGGNLEYVVIKNASTGIEHYAPVTASHVTVSDCEIGIESYDDLDISSSTVTLCTDYGIYVRDGDVTLDDVEISYSDQHGFAVSSLHQYVDIDVYGTYLDVHHNDVHGVYPEGTVNSFELIACDIHHNGSYGALAGTDVPMEIVGGTIEYNGTGVVMVSDGVVGGSTVQYNTTNGVHLLGGEAIVGGCSIVDNPVGIYCAGSGTDPTIFDNDITDGGTGIVCVGQTGGTVAWNHIKRNGTGVLAYSGADPDLGDRSGTLDGHNSIYTKTGFNVANFTTGLTVKAENNYWGKYGPQPQKFYGQVDYDPYLSEEPQSAPARDEDDVTGTADPLPERFALTGAHPNPFNPATTISYDVPAPGGRVRIDVFDVGGRLVTTLVDRAEPPGSHGATWQGRDRAGQAAASGIYFVQMTAGGVVETKKIVLLK
jgi:hypothetical protein